MLLEPATYQFLLKYVFDSYSLTTTMAGLDIFKLQTKSKMSIGFWLCFSDLFFQKDVNIFDLSDICIGIKHF